MKIRELLDLAASNVPEPEKRLEKIYDWQHARVLEAAKWALGVAATLTAALVVAFMKDSDTQDSGASTPAVVRHLLWFDATDVQLGKAAVIAVIVFSLTSGGMALWRGTQVQREYTAALALMARISEFRSLVRLYRRL